jgi:hypothetical protein
MLDLIREKNKAQKLLNPNQSVKQMKPTTKVFNKKEEDTKRLGLSFCCCCVLVLPFFGIGPHCKIFFLLAPLCSISMESLTL